MREAVTRKDKVSPVGEGFMEVVRIGQVHREHVKFTNMEMQDESRSGVGHSIQRHTVNGDIVQVWLRQGREMVSWLLRLE